MMSVSYNESEALAVWHFSGTTNSDADYESYCESIAKLDALSAGDALRIGVLTLDPDNPVPNATWRKRIAEASANIRPNTLFILASERALVRGIMTAINWVRPPTYQAHAVSSFDEALAIVVRLRPDAVAPLSALHDECTRQMLAAESA